MSAGAFMANQTIANLVHEENFDSVYQQGEHFSTLMVNVDENSLLVIVFMAIYIGADPDTYRRGLMLMFPVSARERAGEVLSAVVDHGDRRTLARLLRPHRPPL